MGDYLFVFVGSRRAELAHLSACFGLTPCFREVEHSASLMLYRLRPSWKIRWLLATW